MCAPTSAAASATWRVPAAFTANAGVHLGLAQVDRGEGAPVEDELGPEGGEGAEHGVAVVDPHGVDVGGEHLVVETRARPLGPSSAHRRPPAGTRPASASRRSRPSCPSAPVMRIRTAQVPSGSPGPFDDGGPGPQRLPPVAVVGVPLHRVDQPLLPLDRGRPAELAPQLGGVEDVAAVVAGAVGHDRLERLRLAERGEDPVGDLHDGGLDAAADVVRLAHPAAGEHGVDGRAVVVHVQPLPAVLGAGIERQRLVVERQRAEVRDQLLGELVGAVVVGAVGDRDGQAVGLGVGPHGVVRAGLGGVVGGAGAVRASPR